MEYKKIKKDNYNLHIINTDRFKTINVVVFFSKKFTKKDGNYASLLTQNMVYSTKKYNTKSKIASHSEDLYGANVNSSFSLTGNVMSYSFSLNFLNPKYTSKEYISSSLDFLYEVIYNPNIKDNEFDNKFFDIIKSNVLLSLNSIKDNPYNYAYSEYLKIMYKDTNTSYMYPIVKEVEKITSKDLYEYYKKLFDGSYKIDIFVHGDIDDSIEEEITNKFKFKNENNNKYKFNITHKYDNKVIEKIDTLKFNQSKLFVGYRLNNLTDYELNYVLRVYNTILGTMNDSILFKIVREDNSLCYSIHSVINKYNPSLTVYAGINKDNYDKTLKLIKECINHMKDKNMINRLFDSAKKTINTYLNNYYDDLTSQINMYYYKEFTNIDDIEYQREKINEVTIDDIIKLNNKVELSTIYLLKGDN